MGEINCESKVRVVKSRSGETKAVWYALPRFPAGHVKAEHTLSTPPTLFCKYIQILKVA
jgi:hypothetical protein